MTPNQYEHYLILVESEEKDGKLDMNLKAVAADLSPDKPVTLRHLSASEFTDDIDAYVTKVHTSMDTINDRFIEQILTAVKKDHADGTQLVKYCGFVELVDQLQNAPHLLLANMCASFLTGTAQILLEEEAQQAPAATQ